MVASYGWKVSEWSPYLKYAVRLHSSPLPHGRGPYPPERAILVRWDRWGVACHRLTPGLDGGEILAAEEFQLGPDECHERLDLKPRWRRGGSPRAWPAASSSSGTGQAA